MTFKANDLNYGNDSYKKQSVGYNGENVDSSMPGPHMPFQTAGAVPPPLPPRQPVQSYLGYNDYRPYGSSYGYGSYGSYGYGGGYRGYGGYGSFGSYMPYSSNSYGQIGGHSGDVENRYVGKGVYLSNSNFGFG